MFRYLTTPFSIACVALLLTLAMAETADAQNILDRARRSAERGAQRAVEREAEGRADRAVTGAIECVAGDRACVERARSEGREVTYVDERGNPAPPAAGAAQSQPPAAAGTPPAVPGQDVWANYDFIPGDRVLFHEDFAADRVGNFPRRLEFLRGSLEVVEWQGQRLLRSTSSRSRFSIQLPDELPERFTVEFDLHTTNFLGEAYLVTEPVQDQVVSYRGSYVRLSREAGLLGRGPHALVRTDVLTTRLVPVRVMVDGSYIKVFLDEQRIVNVPNAIINRSRTLQFEINGYERNPVYIGNIRVAAGGQPIYDALMADGRIALQGIYFDTGSDRIRPESGGRLGEIGQMLQQHPELRLRIEGHTDNVGGAEMNQQLSERRAAAVKQFLVSTYQIDAGRLEAQGFGAAQPVAGNDTPEGRQQNRRVELARL